MDLPPRLPPFDQEVARRFLDTTVPSSGLPEFLGLRTTLVEPGRLRVEMPVDSKLLTRFGNMLGGLILGVAEAQFSGMVNTDFKDVFAFGLLVTILIFRPQGLLGRPQVSKV